MQRETWGKIDVTAAFAGCLLCSQPCWWRERSLQPPTFDTARAVQGWLVLPKLGDQSGSALHSLRHNRLMLNVFSKYLPTWRELQSMDLSSGHNSKIYWVGSSSFCRIWGRVYKQGWCSDCHVECQHYSSSFLPLFSWARMIFQLAHNSK